MIYQPIPLILASRSAIRQSMLKSVGLQFSISTSSADEDSLKMKHQNLPIPRRALALAEAKALSVSHLYPDHFTIGADQMCEFEGTVLSKPSTFERAEAQLALLSGKTHFQHSAVVLTRGMDVIFSHVATASLTMRKLISNEISAYIATDSPLASCGSYKLEAMGRHLFTDIQGDNDTIQGLPLVPLLNAMYSHGVIQMKL